LGQSPKSLNNFHIAVSALLTFAVKRSYATINPFDAIDKVRVPAKAPGILPPVECENLLNAAGDDILPLVSIQAFCGVRSAETLRLNWSDVDLTRGFVQIAAEQAKGARRRLVEMSANLKAWLVPDNARSGKLWPWSHKEYYRRLEVARTKAGITSSRCSTPLNDFQHCSTPFNTERLAVLKRVEHLSAVTFRTSLEGRSTRSGGWESQGVKRSVRVQAFTCPR